MKSHLNTIKSVAYLFALILVFSGCGKNDSPNKAENGYHLTATFNGEKKDFTHNAKFQGGGNDNRWEHIVFGGNEAPYPEDYDPSDPEQIPPGYDIELWKEGGNITPGTYTALDEGLISRYAIQTKGGTIVYRTDDENAFTFTITEINKNGIKGTFEGTLEKLEGGKIVVTDGSFNLPYDEMVNPSF